MTDPSAPRAASPELLVYLPGFSGMPRTAEIAEQLKKAWNQRNTSSTPTKENGNGCRKVCSGAVEWQGTTEIIKYTLLENDGRPVLDVLQFPYHMHVARTSWMGSIPLFGVLEMLFGVLFWGMMALFVALPRALGCCYGCGYPQLCRLRNLSQVFWVLSILLVSLAYMAALLWSLYEVSVGSITDHDLIGRITLSVTIAMIVLSYLVPTTWAQRGTDSYQGFLKTTRYYTESSFRRSLQRHIQELVTREQRQWGYTQITIVGYSFGSVIALDSVFPFHEDVGPGKNMDAPTSFDRLITLGCPFNMLRMLLPRYVSNNRIIVDDRTNRLQWTNIYTPADAFGSNFNDSSCGFLDDRNLATMDVNGNLIATTNQQLPAGVPVSILHRRGLLGNSRWFDEVQLTVGSFVGYLAYAHLFYVMFSQEMHLILDDVMAEHIVDIIIAGKRNPQPSVMARSDTVCAESASGWGEDERATSKASTLERNNPFLEQIVIEHCRSEVSV